MPQKENEVEIRIKKSTLLAIIILIIAVIIAFTEFRFECPICKQTKWSIPHKIEYLGIEYKVCGKCYDTMKHIIGDMNNIAKELQNLLK